MGERSSGGGGGGGGGGGTAPTDSDAAVEVVIVIAALIDVDGAPTSAGSGELNGGRDSGCETSDDWTSGDGSGVASADVRWVPREREPTGGSRT